MNIKIIFATLSSFAAIFGIIPYVIDIFKGKTKPHSYSWLIWAILQIIGAVSMFSIGAGWGALSVGVGAVLCSFIFILSLKYGTHNIKIFDTICLIGALIAIVVYFFLHNPVLAVLIVALVDLLGSLPTLRKAYEEPETETASTYMFSFFSTVLALLALSIFTFENSLYLISITITNALSVIIILYRRRELKKLV